MHLIGFVIRIVHPSVLLKYKGATSCIQAAVMQYVKHEIIFLYFCNTLYRCIERGSVITNLKFNHFFFVYHWCFYCVIDYVNMFEWHHALSFSYDYWTVHRIVILSHSTHIICLVMYLIVLSTLCFMRVLCKLKIIIIDFETVRTFLLGLSRQMLHYSIS